MRYHDITIKDEEINYNSLIVHKQTSFYTKRETRVPKDEFNKKALKDEPRHITIHVTVLGKITWYMWMHVKWTCGVR